MVFRLQILDQPDDLIKSLLIVFELEGLLREFNLSISEKPDEMLLTADINSANKSFRINSFDFVVLCVMIHLIPLS